MWHEGLLRGHLSQKEIKENQEQTRRGSYGKKVDQNQTVALEELAISNSFEIAALINVLEEIKRLRGQANN